MRSKLPHVSDEHLKAIAHVSIRSAQLDQLIEICAASLLLPSLALAELILKDARTDKLIQIIQSSLYDRHPSFKAEADKLIREITQARRDRNDVIHFVWGKADKNGTIKTGSVRAFKPDKERSFTAAQVGEVADKLLCAINDLTVITDWSNNHPDVLNPAPRPPPKERILQFPPPSSLWPITDDLPWRAPTQPPPV
jgi:hypothetical protein